MGLNHLIRAGPVLETLVCITLKNAPGRVWDLTGAAVEQTLGNQSIKHIFCSK